MTTLTLGETEVPRIGLGTNRITDTPENRTFLREALAAGVGHIDTAYLYTGGQSEQTIGATLSPVPDGCLLATKGGYGPGEGRPEVLGAQIEESLRRLRTDTIGLYYLHRVDPSTPLEDSLAVIKDYRDRGTIRHVGVSDVSIEQIERARSVVPIAAVQNHYNVSERSHDDVVDYCAKEGITFVAYYPLHGDGGSALARVAAERGVAPSQIALAWLLKRSPVMLPIPGTRSIEHLRQNLGALKIELTDEEFDAVR